jgi:hypothetical protein
MAEAIEISGANPEARPRETRIPSTIAPASCKMQTVALSLSLSL